MTLETQKRCSITETAKKKNIKCVKNDRILKRGKNGHFAKAIVWQNG